MLDQVMIGICLEVTSDTLEAIKQVAGIDLEEAVDTNVADIRLIAVQAVPDIAVLFDILATGALIEFLGYLDSCQAPFSAGYLEVVRNGMLQDVGF